MNFSITKPRNKALRQVIDYFLFIKTAGNDEEHNYTTYPNNNCCLALYKEHRVTWAQPTNRCSIERASTAPICSRLYGWHKQPFKVSVSGELDQICILFTITGLSQFTAMPLNRIALGEDSFVEIFGPDTAHFRQQLFAAQGAARRTKLLETFLLQRLQPRPIHLIQHYLTYTRAAITENGYKIKDFCKEHYVSESTLFRSCQETIGESPKNIKTKYRFRLFLQQLDAGVKLTDLAHGLNYADQSHLIKEVKKFTGLSPKRLAARVRKEENDFFVTY